MGDEILYLRHTMKLVLLIACVGICLAQYEPETTMEETTMDTPSETEENLLTAAKELHNTVPTLLQEHTAIIAKHAAMIQSGRAKAYAHNFKNSKKAIKSALNSLTAQLHAGHKHDKHALSGARNFGNGVIGKAELSGKKKHAAASKAYRKTKANYDRALASFRAALNIEASNAHRTCVNAHREYNALAKDVQSNV